jgi:hypothetical protein
LKGIYPANQWFQSGERLIVLQIGLFRGGDETHVSAKEILHCYMQEHLAHSFTVRIEVVLKGILTATQVFRAV